MRLINMLSCFYANCNLNVIVKKLGHFQTRDSAICINHFLFIIVPEPSNIILKIFR